MSPVWLVVIGLWCSLVFVSTGCDSRNSSAASASADVYLTHPRTGVSDKLTLQHVINNLGGGGIIVVTGRSGEVDADGIATASGNLLEIVRIGAGRRITVTNDAANNVEVLLLPEADEKAPALQLSALLHVAVPLGTDLHYIGTPAGGNIEVYGNVGNVTAVISNSGNIEVRGADGNVNLSTQRGSIIADIMPGRDITTRAAEGSIDIHAVDAFVSAATTGGNVRFYGTLRPGQTHYFTTTGAGGVQVALLPYPDKILTPQVYRFNVATSASPVNVEYPPRGTGGEALPICGFIYSSGPYDYHIENTPAFMGRIQVSPVITGAYFFSGTLATKYFRFDTNQTQVSFYTPITQSIHIYTAAQLNQIIAGKESIAPECQAALDSDLGNAIVLGLKAERGPVYIHHMIMRRD